MRCTAVQSVGKDVPTSEGLGRCLTGWFPLAILEQRYEHLPKWAGPLAEGRVRLRSHPGYLLTQACFRVGPLSLPALATGDKRPASALLIHRGAYSKTDGLGKAYRISHKQFPGIPVRILSNPDIAQPIGTRGLAAWVFAPPTTVECWRYIQRGLEGHSRGPSP